MLANAMGLAALALRGAEIVGRRARPQGRYDVLGVGPVADHQAGVVQGRGRHLRGVADGELAHVVEHSVLAAAMAGHGQRTDAVHPGALELALHGGGVEGRGWRPRLGAASVQPREPGRRR